MVHLKAVALLFGEYYDATRYVRADMIPYPKEKEKTTICKGWYNII